MFEDRARVALLVADAAERARLAAHLSAAGHEVLLAQDGAELSTVLRTQSPDAGVVDLRAPGAGQAIALAAGLSPAVTVVAVVAAPGECLRALREGADAVLPTPIEPEALAILTRRIAERRELRRENERLRRALWAERGVGGLVGESRAMRRTLDFAWAAARADNHVLIVGEPGAGKDALARAIHAEGPRAAGPFEAVPCTAEEAMLRDVVLGAAGRPGALAAAAGGTLVLREVDALPASLQAALADRLAAAPVEGTPAPPRIIATTGRDLRAQAAEGRFRDDLLGRLGAVALRVPPLRERREDVPLLARAFLEVVSAELRRPVPRVAPEAMDALLGWPWPGNVHELRRAVERGALTAREGVIEAADLALGSPGTGATPLSLQDLERRHIAEVLAHTGGNVSHAARLLCIDRVTLYNKMRRYGIRKDTLHRG
ncbi:MAG TPA: sigma 54-interacting transcriptional regulator [Anaeromyxobacteraceae bacterium]|nr:sigma 54-interacting transcriptional regulator [Anaeromyxobacteraceae bacterium]